jgi:hypothetical protein
MAKKLEELRVAIKNIAAENRRSARGLQSEIDRGIELRQSIESKQARVDVLTVCADQLERILDDRGLRDYIRVYGLKVGDDQP